MLAYFRPPRLKRSIWSFLHDRYGHLDTDGSGITYTAEGLNFPSALHLRRYNYSEPESMQLEIQTRTGLYKATLFPTSFGEIGISSLDGILKSGKNKCEIKSSQEKHRMRMKQNAMFFLDMPEFKEALLKALEAGSIEREWLGPNTKRYLRLE